MTKNIIISNSFLTCFSKALGTSLRSSDKLWLMRSLRLFSMICIRRKKKKTELQTQLKKRQNRLTSNDLIRSPLFSSFEPESARRCLETWTQWLGCTAKIVLKQESEMSKKGHRGRKKKKIIWFSCILLLLPSLIWHRGRMAHQLPSSNLFFGHRKAEQCPGEEGRWDCFHFNAFLDISLSEMTCCSPFRLSKSTFRKDDYIASRRCLRSHGAPARCNGSMSSSEYSHPIWIVFVCELSSYRPERDSEPHSSLQTAPLETYFY